MSLKFFRCFAILIVATALFSIPVWHTAPSSTIAAAAPPLPNLQVVKIHHSLNTLNPLTTILPYLDNTLLVSDQSGRIYLFKPSLQASNVWDTALFLDLSSQVKFESELGFYSIARSPNFATNQTLYLSYTNLAEDLVIERFNVVTKARSLVITIPKPDRDDTDYHRAGQIEFYNGLLYISTGDNGIWEPYEVGHPSQDLNSLLGKLLRIDVESGNPLTYTIPADNPYVGMANHRPEIWAYGLRNPYKFAFDDITGDMLIADVGNALYEEINLIPAGSNALNFGWRCYEGTASFPFDDPACATAVNTNPIHVYRHATVSDRNRCSIIGGRLYRGSEYPLLEGMYLFTDFCESRIRAVRQENGVWASYLLADLPLSYYPTVIGEDAQGTMYVGGIGSDIYQLVDLPLTTLPPILKTMYLPLLHKN